MAIGFSEIAADIRVPGAYVEIRAAEAGGGSPRFRSLLIGQKLAAGRVAAATPTRIGNPSDAVVAFGAGSMLAQMAAIFRRQNPYGELWAVGLDDAGAGTKAVWTVTVNSAATAAGTIALYVGGRRVAVGVGSGDTANNIATAIKNAIDDLGTRVPAAAAAAAAVVTITARHAGAAPDLTVTHSLYPGETLPAGVTLAIANGTPGATDPTLTDALDAVGAETFGLIATPYSAAAAMTSIENELKARWGATVALDGNAITAVRGTASVVGTLGGARNSEFSTMMDMATSPTPAPEWAAAVAGAASLSAAADPALPFNTVRLVDVLAPPVKDRRTWAERQTLLTSGIATHTVDVGGAVRIERLITTYQTVGGDADDAWLDLNTPLTLAYLRSDYASRMKRKFGRAKAAGDTDRARSGQTIATPKVIRAETIAWFDDMFGLGLVENREGFVEGLLVQRSQPDRIDVRQPTDIVNPLHVIAGLLDFRL